MEIAKAFVQQQHAQGLRAPPLQSVYTKLYRLVGGRQPEKKAARALLEQQQLQKYGHHHHPQPSKQQQHKNSHQPKLSSIPHSSPPLAQAYRGWNQRDVDRLIRFYHDYFSCSKNTTTMEIAQAFMQQQHAQGLPTNSLESAYDKLNKPNGIPKRSVLWTKRQSHQFIAVVCGVQPQLDTGSRSISAKTRAKAWQQEQADLQELHRKLELLRQ